ncbi:MAG: hypothetical protein QW292_10330 [Candidatus Parvarchaeota archaeon]
MQSNHMNIMNYSLTEKYKEIAKYDDKLLSTGELVDWESFGPILRDLYKNNTD